MADYEFRYSPLTGRLTGKQMIEQTEQAINQLSSLVDSAAGQVEIISTLANEANENAATALETAEEALATTGRTYITVSTQTDANNYYDSQLIYIADSTSTNIPVADTGMLEVKTNDNKTACEQVFISDSSGDAYYRNGEITAETVGDVTTYTVTWGGWSSQPASQQYVQQELTNYAPLTELTNYLPLSGGTLTGSIITENGTILGKNGNTGAVSISGGGALSSSSGAKLDLFGASNSTDPGAAILQAGDGNGYKQLVCKPSGVFTWGGKEVEMVNASGANYIRFESGVQICWGAYISTLSSGWTTITFPVAFKSGTTPAANINSSSGASNYYAVNSLSNTSFKTMGAGNPIHYIAVGYWK